MEFNGWGNRIWELNLRKNLFGYTCANSSVCVNGNVLACFVHNKITSVDEILSVAQDCKGQDGPLQITDQL